MQRGRIIQYNPNDGTGIVLVGQVQQRFSIGQWRGDEAPQLNRVAEVEEDAGIVTRITPVSERVLLAEKANDLKSELAALGSTLGALGSGFGSRALSAAGGAASGMRSAAHDSSAAAPGSWPALASDRSMLGGYAAFVIATAVLTFVSIQVPLFGDRNLTLLAATGIAEQVGSSARPMLFGAYLSLLVPVLWKHRASWLALAAPLLVIVAMTWSAQRAFAAPFSGAEAANAADYLGREAVEEMRRAAADMISFGLGFYASIAAALFLAWTGFRRFRARTA